MFFDVRSNGVKNRAIVWNNCLKLYVLCKHGPETELIPFAIYQITSSWELMGFNFICIESGFTQVKFKFIKKNMGSTYKIALVPCDPKAADKHVLLPLWHFHFKKFSRPHISKVYLSGDCDSPRWHQEHFGTSYGDWNCDIKLWYISNCIISAYFAH